MNQDNKNRLEFEMPSDQSREQQQQQRHQQPKQQQHQQRQQQGQSQRQQQGQQQKQSQKQQEGAKQLISEKSAQQKEIQQPQQQEVDQKTSSNQPQQQEPQIYINQQDDQEQEKPSLEVKHSQQQKEENNNIQINNPSIQATHHDDVQIKTHNKPKADKFESHVMGQSMFKENASSDNKPQIKPQTKPQTKPQSNPQTKKRRENYPKQKLSMSKIKSKEFKDEVQDNKSPNKLKQNQMSENSLLPLHPIRCDQSLSNSPEDKQYKGFKKSRKDKRQIECEKIPYSMNQKELKTPLNEKQSLKMLVMDISKGWRGTLSPQFKLIQKETDEFIMSCSKNLIKPTTFYFSSKQGNYQENGPFYCGKMKSNLLGDQLNIYGTGLNIQSAYKASQTPRQLLATIVYATDYLGGSKPRDFKVYVKKQQYSYYKDFDGVSIYENIVPLNMLYKNPRNANKINVYQNRKPQWDDTKKLFVLDFKGIVRQKSVKNFILSKESNHEQQVIIFGKLEDSVYIQEIHHPISPFLGFGIAMASFDMKISLD